MVPVGSNIPLLAASRRGSALTLERELPMVVMFSGVRSEDGSGIIVFSVQTPHFNRIYFMLCEEEVVYGCEATTCILPPGPHVNCTLSGTTGSGYRSHSVNKLMNTHATY